MLTIEPILAFTDNYIWLVIKNKQCLIVDPGESHACISYITANKLEVSGILITHAHPDHIGGVANLLEHYNVPVFDPNNLKSLNFNIADISISVLQTNGHTANDISYLCDNKHLFCGDAIFSAGCGRVNSSYDDMYETLVKFKNMPDDTIIYPAHEYTLANLAFAREVMPTNKAVIDYQALVSNMRKKNVITLPTTIKKEKEINPFLRLDDKELQNSVALKDGKSNSEFEIFKKLRLWKNLF